MVSDGIKKKFKNKNKVLILVVMEDGLRLITLVLATIFHAS